MHPVVLIELMLYTYFHMNAPLERRQAGFTIVELLIVIVVIAILAGITIVSYNGITRRTIEVSMKSDLQGASSQVELDNVTSGSYPTDKLSAGNGAGLSDSGDNILSYKRTAGGYCVTVTNPRTPDSYYLDSASGVIQSGACAVTVTTLAGTGTSGFQNGAGSVAQFRYPTGIAVNSSGTVFVADPDDHRIRSITPSGVVSTYAGTGVYGSTNGPALNAQFTQPFALAMDASNNLYVAERSGCRIRMITPAAVVSTLAGSNTSCGSTNGTGSGALFNWPWGLGVDPAGANVYVADTDNGLIRKVVTATGLTSTFAGLIGSGFAEGPTGTARFSYPGGVAAAADGTVYVADSGNNRIRKISGGVVSTLAGQATSGTADGTGAAAQFNYPTGISLGPNGDLYVVDNSSQRIRKVTQAGVVTTITSGGVGYTNGTPSSAQFDDAYHVFVDSQNFLYIADPGNHRIRVIQ